MEHEVVPGGTGARDGAAALARRFHREVVGPLLASSFPGVPLAVGRLGSGSDVLGLDDATSTDHDWGLRLTVLVGDDADGAGPGGLVVDVDAVLERDLPETFAGHPVRFPATWDPAVRHRVEVGTVAALAEQRLGLDAVAPWDAVDWLGLTGQAVLEVVAGPVFSDPTGDLTRLRDRLAWYPDDVWRYAVASAWQQLEQELPFVGRTGSVGDEAGSAVLTARLVRRAVHLGLLLDRRWSPYPKWAGTVFARSPSATALPHLQEALAARAWPDRQEHLRRALEELLARQRAVGLPVTARATQPFHDRPFLGVALDLVDLLHASVGDGPVRDLPRGVGAVEQWVDGVDVLVPARRRHAVARAALAAR